jgi:hypothetical protein
LRVDVVLIEDERAAGLSIIFARAASPMSANASCALRARWREVATALEIAIAVEVALHRIGELAHGRDALGRHVRGRRAHDGVELGRQLVGRRRHRPARMQRLAGEDLEQHAAERVDVGARVEVGRAEVLLGRHVADGADDRRVRLRGPPLSPGSGAIGRDGAGRLETARFQSSTYTSP